MIRIRIGINVIPNRITQACHAPCFAHVGKPDFVLFTFTAVPVYMK
jgi:hypothetical protein